MADQTTSSQSNNMMHVKNFTPYLQPSKTFQPYVPPASISNTGSNGNKSLEAKNQQIKLNKYPQSNQLVSNSNGTANGLNSPKIEVSQFKPIPSFLQNRTAMKNSIINSEQQSALLKPLAKNQSHAQQQIVKKIARTSEYPEMKSSNIQLGNQGYKVPAFLNRQKKGPHSAMERPESSKDLSNVKDNLNTEASLSSSYGNSMKKGLDQSMKYLQIKQAAKDPAQQWVKTSWNKKKQRVFTINDFVQIKQLGTGKYGKVYLARQKQTNFICALKILEKALIKQQQISEQIIRELKIQSYLNHTNIIKMYGFFDDAVNIYLIMECATGGQLFKILKKHQSMPESKVAPLMRQVCQAICELHSNRIIHRDIKPENIVLHDNILKLCDFGWSVYCDSNLRTTFCGTPLYVGPEMLKGSEYDEKIDIWSLGVMMYEMLVGENPFKITKRQDLIKIIKDEIVIPNYVELSAESKSFLYACLQKNPNERMSIRELLNHEFFKKYPEKNDKKLGI